MKFVFSARSRVKNATGIPAKGPYVLVAGTGWCGHSMRSKPVISAYAKALQALKPVGGGKLPVVYALDCDKHKDASKRLGVKSFPTVFFADANGKRKIVPRDLPSLFAHSLKDV